MLNILSNLFDMIYFVRSSQSEIFMIEYISTYDQTLKHL